LILEEGRMGQKQERLKLTRRQFLKGAAVAGVALAMPMKFGMRRAHAFSQSPIITKFSKALPGLGPTGIPLATKTTTMFGGVPTDVYNLGVAEFSQQIHPDLPNPTHFWGYYDLPTGAGSQRYLGGVIVATRGTPLILTVTNQLPNHQLIPIDDTMMAGPGGLEVGDLPYNRIVTHLHGGFPPWYSDGTPFQWYTPGGVGYQAGPSFRNVPGTNPPAGTATFYYPMDQSARLVWYHDHAIGITRTNAYSGIASALVITDAFETYLLSQNLLPDLVGVPLVIQDKTFLFRPNDPSYPIATAVNGDLWYPWEYEIDSLPNGKGRFAYGPDEVPPAVITHPALPPIAEIPEFFADTALINGAPYPTLRVREGTFRFRLLNGSQARFWHLNLYEEAPGNTGEVPYTIGANGKPVLTATAGPALYQFGTEGGFLPAVVQHPNGVPCPLDPADPTGNTVLPTGPFNLLLAPAERADLLINFAGQNGKSFIFYSDSPAPFPGGDPRNDYYTGDPNFTNAALNTYGLSGGAPTTLQGQGPNTRTIMKIVVDNVNGAAAGPFPNLAALNLALSRNFTGGNPVPAQQPPLLYPGADVATPGPVPVNPALFPAGTVIRNLTLNEDFDDYGRLIQRQGTTINAGLTTVDGLTVNGLNNQGLPTWGRSYLDNPTETPNVGAVEVWNIYNLTGDVHPIHFHLVNVQIIQRASFDLATPTFTPTPGTERLPDPNEIGWKETVRMNPGEVTTVIMKFDMPKVPFTVSPSVAADRGINGSEYVWHCHILEHEEHDMMRPLVVLGPNPLAAYPPAQTFFGNGAATFTIYNGVPPYTITSNNPNFPPNPATVGGSGGTFTVFIPEGAGSQNTTITFTITDDAGAIVTVTLKLGAAFGAPTMTEWGASALTLATGLSALHQLKKKEDE
jgi:spore coat protein A, manganese oxidase